MDLVKFRTIEGQDIYLRLFFRSDTSICIVACDKNGRPLPFGNILFLNTKTGRLKRFYSISPFIGICTGKLGGIVESAR